MRGSAAHRGEGLPEDRVRVFLDATEVIGTAEALGVDFGYVLGARRTRGEPAVLGDHLDAADRRVVARCRGEDALDGLAVELPRVHAIRRQRAERGLLLGGRRRVGALVGGLAELARELAPELAGIAARPGGHLGGEQARD